MSKKPILIIAAVAVMLVGATSAYGDYTQEVWDGWFSWGTLTYNDYNYYYSADGGAAFDTVTEAGTHDLFYMPSEAQFVVAFVCSQLDDTIYLAVSDVDGSKPHGESGTKEGSGNWSGSAIRRKNQVETTFTSVVGTWDTSAEDEYFDYNMCPCPPNGPPTYSAGWDVSNSTPSGLDGDGGSSGQRGRL